MFAPDLAKLKRSIQDIYDYPLRPGATDTLNRLLRSGAPDEELADRVIDLRDRDELTRRGGARRTRGATNHLLDGAGGSAVGED